MFSVFVLNAGHKYLVIQVKSCNEGVVMINLFKFKQLIRWIRTGFMSYVLIILLPHLSAEALGITVSDANGSTSFSHPSGYFDVYIKATIDQPNITAIQFSFTYDPKLLTAFRAVPGSATTTWTLVNDISQPGVVVVGMYSLTPLPVGTETIASIRLAVVNSPVGTWCSLNIPVSTVFALHNLKTEFNNIPLTSSQITPGSFNLSSATISSDGSVLNAPSSGNLVTSAGTWSFGSTPSGSDYPILFNGSPARNGVGVLILYSNGQIYIENSANQWSQWGGFIWISISGDPRSSGQSAPVITTQPVNMTVLAGATATFTVTASGTPTYLWKLSTNGGATFLIIGDNATSATYTTGTTYTSMNGYQYQVAVSNGTAVTYSNAAILTVLPATETITASAGSGGTISPNGTVTVNNGANQLFTITPQTGYAPSVMVDGSPATLIANTYTFSNVTIGHTIAVTFINSSIPHPRRLKV